MRPWVSPSLTFKPKRHSLGGPGPWAGHLAFAYDLVAAERPTLLVELGAFYGESYFGFCQAAEENSIVCTSYAVDTWQGDAHGGFYGEDIYTDVDTYNRANYSSYSHLLRMTFDEASTYFSADSIDILHIDGHHSYESVRIDFESWIHKVRPGGIVLLHDICIRTAGFGVWRFWQELAASFPHFAFAHSAGLGVLVKPGGKRPGQFLSELLSADSDEQARIGRYYAVLADRFALAFDSAQLRKQTMNPALCPVQVFYSLGEGYSEENSAVRLVEVGQRKRIVFELPAGIPAKPLRIDPADRACIVEISEISVLAADRSIVLWKWDGTESVSPLQIGGTARLLPSQAGITLLSDGIDPQVFLPDVGGESFAGPLELDLVVRITASAEFNGRIVPLGDLDQGGAPPELDRQFLRDEVRLLTELTAKVDGIAAEVSRKADDLARLANEGSSRILGELEIRKEEAARARRESDAEIAELRDRLKTESMRCKDLQQSWSWRVTAPARFLLGRWRHNRTP